MIYTGFPHINIMKIVIENPEFKKQANTIWDESERLSRGSQERRKIRWGMRGAGKRGGIRIIYFNKDKDRLILEYSYKKSDIQTLKLQTMDYGY